MADARNETLTAHAALAGAAAETVRALMACAITDEAADVLAEAGALTAVMESLTEALGARLRQRAGASLQAEAVIFSLQHGIVGMTAQAEDLCALHRPPVDDGPQL